VPLPGSDPDFFAGEIGAAKDRFFVSANYSLDKVDFTLRGTYIGQSYLDDQFLAGFDLARNDEAGRIPAEFYADAQIRYRAADEFEFFVGVDNLLGNDPTVLPSGLPGNTTGAETDAGTYDAIGRRFYVGTKLRF
jgi:iron complex outermembrane receptor protein